eukprot:TRINITY_DN71895_c0_g1_i1.p1 TRINITY_DN71895_c0_g1~~TRINITY_DN71895_c0_g1_i1.p1  ORF type:complete len:500 (-),score=128.12 TRINITY_DN71895_c0_g1_i1:92-1504(-)
MAPALDEVSFDLSASESEEEATSGNNWALNLVEDATFQMLVAGVILLNTVMMAIQTDVPHWTAPAGCVANASASAPVAEAAGSQRCVDMWHVVNGIFLAIFTVELALRLTAFGCKGFFCNKEDWAWNLFDFSIVFLAACDYIQKTFFSNNHGNANMLIILRALRILRILRVLRLFKFLKKLNLLVRGLLSSFDNVFWIMLLLAFMIFISAIFCTQMIGNSPVWPEEERPNIERKWGSVGKSSFTLFQILTLDDWAAITNEVERKMPMMTLFFIMFVIFGSFVILSLLTGVMADHMNMVREAAEEEEMKAKHADLQEELELLHQDFDDSSNKHEISRARFAELMEKPQTIHMLKRLDMHIDHSDVNLIFDCMDTEERGRITWDQFRRGLHEIRQQDLQPKHIMELHGVTNLAMQEVDRRKGSFNRSLEPPSHKCEIDLDRAEGKMDRLEDHINLMESKLKEVIEALNSRNG